MKRTTLLALAFVLLVIAAHSYAQEDDLSPKWDRWLSETVVYIISDAERDAFLKLTSEKQRKAFEESFWLQRDPTPGTKENQFKQEHFERIEFANKYFGPGSVNPGWKTDRGRIYITLGPPRTRDTYPSGAATYPMELWFFEGDVRRGLPAHFYLLFFQRFGAGDYELYNPVVDGPQALVALNSTRQDHDRLLLEMDAELARAAYNLLPAGETVTDRPSLGSLTLFSRIDQFHNTGIDTSYVERILSGESTTHIDYNFSNIQFPHIFMPAIDESGNSFIDVAFAFTPAQLQLGQYDNEVYGAFIVEFTLSSEEGREFHSSSDKFEFKFPSCQIKIEREIPRIYNYRLPCIPGDYLLTVRIRNEVSRQIFLLHGNVSVPALIPNKPGISRLMLCRDVDSRDKYPGDGAMRYSGFYTTPLIPGIWDTSTSLYAYSQIYLPPAYRSSNGTFVVFAELLNNEGASIEQQQSELPLTAFSETGLFHLLTRWPEMQLAPGQYSIAVSAEFANDKHVHREVPFQISDSAITAPVLLTHLSEGPDHYAMQMALAEMWMARGDLKAAQVLYQQVLQQNSQHAEARSALAQVFMSDGRNQEALDLLLPALSSQPDDADLLLLAARSYVGIGEFSKAIKMLSRLLATSPENIKGLNLLGYAQLLNGDLKRARAAWGKSLKINEHQAEIRDALNRAENIR